MSEAPKVLGGRYRIDALIGRGGMSDVYRGTDVVLQRPVAIKILTDRSEDVRKRFLREAQSMARLNHPNIVGVYDAAQSDGVSYIVMELVAGRTLATIRPAELTVHSALRYMIELLEALAFAHENNIIHRDVKPANIMILPSGGLKVMDFGLSRRTSEMSSASNTGEIVGTIAYLAPERFLGKIADARSDLYSVGIVMYEIFTGTVPFKNESDDLVAVIFAHVNEAPTPPHAINPSVPAPIERMVLRPLEKDPDRRYQSAREVIADIKALLGLSAPAPAPAPPKTPPQNARTAAPPPPPARNAAAPQRAPVPPPQREFQPQPQAPAGGGSSRLFAQGHASPEPTEHSDSDLRSMLRRTFGNTQTLNEGYAFTLAGMLAARKRDWPEASRAYLAALRSFADVNNQIEHAKTALKYATMVAAKGTEGDPEESEVDHAMTILEEAQRTLKSRGLQSEYEEGERVLYALRRMGLRFR